MKKLAEDYDHFKIETSAGKHGKTAQYYYTFPILLQNYLMLSRSIRTGDFQLFKFILPKLTDLFFTFNQPNYARWLVKYHDNLSQVSQTHPGLDEIFKQGYFGVKRTNKSFSKQPIDLTLEQTVNADASKILSCVAHFTNSISARQRWAKSHDIRATILAHVLEKTGLRAYQDITHDLQQNEITKSSLRLQQFMSTLTKYKKPFYTSLDHNFLFNVYSGKAATSKVEDFLPNAITTGKKQREQCIDECATDATRFEQPP